MKNNLIFVQKLCEDNLVSIDFFSNSFCAKDLNARTTLLIKEAKDGLYLLPTMLISSTVFCISYHKIGLYSTLLHNRLSHPNFEIVKQAARAMNQELDNSSNDELCTAYEMAKSHRLPMLHTHTHSLHPFDIVHVDLWGLFLVVSMKGMRYFFMLVDDCTIFMWIYVLSNKNQATSILLDFLGLY